MYYGIYEMDQYRQRMSNHIPISVYIPETHVGSDYLILC